MSEEYVISYLLDIKISPQTQRTIDIAELTLMRTLSLLRRMGLPENIDNAVNSLQRIAITARVAYSTLMILQSSLMATPLGWVLFGVGAVGMAITAADTMNQIQGIG